LAVKPSVIWQVGRGSHLWTGSVLTDPQPSNV
jgi:hypothetical protein